jgi:hypothetical protein
VYVPKFPSQNAQSSASIPLSGAEETMTGGSILDQMTVARLLPAVIHGEVCPPR